jgi:hypothetical protein
MALHWVVIVAFVANMPTDPLDRKALHSSEDIRKLDAQIETAESEKDTAVKIGDHDLAHSLKSTLFDLTVRREALGAIHDVQNLTLHIKSMHLSFKKFLEMPVGKGGKTKGKDLPLAERAKLARVFAKKAKQQQEHIKIKAEIAAKEQSEIDRMRVAGTCNAPHLPHICWYPRNAPHNSPRYL